MERDVFPEVAPLLARFVRTRLDLDDHDTPLELGGVIQSPAAWARHFGAEGTPSFVLIGQEGEPIAGVGGYQPVLGFSLLLAYVATGAYRHADFDTYVRRTSRAY